MIALAWPFVALVAIAVAALFASRWLPARDIGRRVFKLEGQLHDLFPRVHKLEQTTPAAELAESVAFLGKEVGDLRKRAEANELRKLGGVR
jgi:hypothetical protein